MAETTTIPDYPRGITFEQVWAALMEDRARLVEEKKKRDEEYALAKKEREEEYARTKEERDKEYARAKKEREEEYALEKKKREEEYARAKEERDKEDKKRDEEFTKWKQKRDEEWAKTERIVRRNSKQMGDLHRRFGQLAEHLVAPSISKRFNELGYHFGTIAAGGVRLEDEHGKTKTEIDLLLENGEIIMAVEVKAKPALKHIEQHLRRLEILREHRDKLRDMRKVRGAIAGAIFGTEEKKATLDAGLYVIEQSGDTMKIEAPPDFVPLELLPNLTAVNGQ
jgi:hypothetical protein